MLIPAQRSRAIPQSTQTDHLIIFRRAPDARDSRDAATLGAALLDLRKRAPKAPLSKLYDKHRAKLEAL